MNLRRVAAIVVFTVDTEPFIGNWTLISVVIYPGSGISKSTV